MQRTDSFEKTQMLGKIEGRRRKREQRMRCMDDMLWEMVEDRATWRAAVHGVKRSNDNNS